MEGENFNKELKNDIVERNILKIEGTKSNDLLLAGNRSSGNEFQFKISQRKIATDSYLAIKQLFRIQALPIYRKTVLIKLPLVVMKTGDSHKKNG